MTNRFSLVIQNRSYVVPSAAANLAGCAARGGSIHCYTSLRLGALAGQFLTICLAEPLYDAGPDFAVASPIDEFLRAPMWADIGSPSGGSSFPKCPDDQKRIIIQHHQ